MSKHDPRPIQEVLEAVRQTAAKTLEEANLSQEEIDERAALVMNHTHIIDVILKDLHAMLLKQMTKGKTELANNVAGLVGLKVTTKGQERNKAYMYDLTKGK
tara:strand:+ start:1489 stop:1794 length:306 start_codon:yes stop_codon:yes gene_type:complete